MGKKPPKEADVRTVCLLHSSLRLTVDWCDIARVTIDMLSDVALLEIFGFYVDGARNNTWNTLLHVCRKWRDVVFGSPRRLNLQLYCTPSTPVRETIDAWPLLPIQVFGYGPSCEEWGVDNIIAVLEHNDRIRELNLTDYPKSQMEEVFAAMQQSFPALEVLWLTSTSETEVVPASFLGGSAPRLQTLLLDSVPFPGLPKLLLSATHLVDLHLHDIPHSGYFSPEAIATGLSALTSLERLYIIFKSPRSRPDQRRRPLPLTRSLLPSLTHFEFKGVSEYLDDLVARIDAPLLDELDITFFHQLIFDTPQLTQFINRTPKIIAFEGAFAEFFNSSVFVTTTDQALRLSIPCRQSDWQLSSLAQVFSTNFISAIEHLYIQEGAYYPPSWQDDIETGQWLELLHRLTAVKYLHISPIFTPRIAPTLQELAGGRATEVLPALQTLYLEETLPSGVQETIDKFVAARELAGHPIVVSRWEDWGL